MSRIIRQREALNSGFNKVRVVTPPLAVFVTRTLSTGIGSPLDLTGTLRNAPMPYLSLWAGIRTDVDLDHTTPGGYTTLIDVGLIPYSDQIDNPPTRALRPFFTPLEVFGGGFNVQGAYRLIPWPAGNLLVRITVQRLIDPNPLGVEFDMFCAWTVNSTAAYPSMPAIQDLQDL